jgi:transcriptional regulator with XRE-family HTH domain
MYIVCTLVQGAKPAHADLGCSFIVQAPSERSVPRKKSELPSEGHFGDRLATMRKAAGLSQLALEKVSGVSRRMLAYYEARASLPPGHVLTALAEALGVSVDQLVGKKTRPAVGARMQSSRLLRRLHLMEKLPLKDKRELLGVIDTYLVKNRLVRRAS